MYQLIASVVGLFSSHANMDKANYSNAMQYYEAEKARVQRNEKLYKSMEFIIPGLLLIGIVLFYIKVAKKWM